MARKYHTIWDGVEFRQVSPAAAKRLVDEDMAQDVSGKTYSATELKFRRDFTGYKTREMRAENLVKPAAEVHDKPEKVAKEDTKKPTKKKVSKKKAAKKSSSKK